MKTCLVVVVAACSGAAAPDPAKPPANTTTTTIAGGALSKDDAVFEAVVLHDLAATTLGPGEAVCLAVRGATNDGSALLAAVKARFPTTVRDGECSGGGPAGPVQLTATGGKAVRLDIGPIQWGPDGAAHIGSGGAYRGGGVRAVEYTVESSAGRWKVTSEKLMQET